MTTTQAAAFTGEEIGAMTNPQIAALLSITPVVLDLDGNGISTTSAAQGVNFDITATGHANKYGWTSGSDGLLAIDLNHDGRIADGSELFGVGMKLANGQRAANGYQAMAQYDSNGDGVLDARDAHFKDLVVWVDANHDGKTEAGELKTLADLHITSLDLHGLAGTTTSHGNLLGLTSSYTTSDGATHAMADVWFARDGASGTAPTTHATPPALGDLLSAPPTDVLPGADKTHAAPVHASEHATTAMAHGLMHPRPLDDDDAARHAPLI